MSESHIVGLYTLSAEIELYGADTSSKSGRRAETLIKTDDLRVVLVTMQQDAVLQDHSAPGTITIHALTGQFAVNVSDDDIILEPGTLLSLAPGVVHGVRAIKEGAFLLTIAWSTQATHDVL